MKKRSHVKPVVSVECLKGAQMTMYDNPGRYHDVCKDSRCTCGCHRRTKQASKSCSTEGNQILNSPVLVSKPQRPINAFRERLGLPPRMEGR